MFDIESIVKAESLQQALSALQNDPGAMLIAGGTDMLIKIREGKHAGAKLVSINGISELQGVQKEADGSILIKPLTTFDEIYTNSIAQSCLPVLCEACNQAGGPQLRHIATIGGNVCNGATSADSAPALLCMNAQLEISHSGGVRCVPLSEFYLGPGKVALAHGEVLSGIRIAKADYDGFFGCYIKFAQRSAMDIATLGCAAWLKLNAEATHIEQLRLAFGVAAPTPIRCYEAEKAAEGMALSQELLDVVARAALAESAPRTSWRASKEFRQQLISQLSRRAVVQAATQAKGVFV